MSNKGFLYLLPVPIAEDATDVSFIEESSKLNDINIFCVESEKAARRSLRQLGYKKPFDDSIWIVHNKDTDGKEIKELIAYLNDGKDICLISDAGCPGIADPGAEVVFAAHENEIRVVPFIGPSSIFLALMSSGLSGQCFTFHGYLPVDKPKLVTKLKEMEKDSFKNNCAQIFMETPYRNQQLMQVINSSLHDETFLTVACDINSTSEFIKTKKVSYWKQHNENLHKRPCIYIIQKK